MRRADGRTTLDLIYEAALEPELWPEALTRVADELEAIGGMLTGMSFRAPEKGWYVNARLDPDIWRIVMERHQDNPWGRAMVRVPYGHPVCTASLVDHALIRRTAFHEEVLEPQVHVSMLAIRLPLGPDIDTGGVAFALKARAEPAVLRLAESLAPHLQRAAMTSLRLAEASALNAALGDTLARLEQSVLLVDGEGRVLFASASAECLLRSGDALLTEQGRLVAIQSAETRAMRRLIAAASQTALGYGSEAGGALGLPSRSGDTPLAVVVAPLRDLRPWLGTQRPTAIILAGAPGVAPTASASTMRALYGLTPAEATVAAAIADGRPLARAAADLGITSATARTHLKRVFDKTGVHRQAELVRLVAGLPRG